MAAPMKCVTICRRNCLTFLNSRSLFRGTLQWVRFSTNTDKDGIESTTQSTQDANDDFEREVAKLRDVTNMTKWQKRRFQGKIPILPENSGAKFFKARSFYRRLYAEVGKSSDLNPGILWPSHTELESLVHEEREYEPTFHEVMKKIQDRKSADAEEARQRDEKIEKSMSKMDELIRQYHEKQKMSVGMEQKQSDKTEQLLTEFREIYGYNATERDGKFKEFKMMKKMEEKLEKKKAKKQSKKEQTAKSLQDLIDRGA